MIASRRDAMPREELSEKNLARVGVPRLFFDAEIDDYIGNDDIRIPVENYIKHIHDMFDECVNLTFWGSNGNGKTYLTSIILKNAYRYRYTARRITLTRLINIVFKPDKSDEELLEIKNIYNAEFLVIDEIGKEPNIKSGNNIVVFEELMKYREELGYPTILCANLNLKDLSERYGATINSLIKQSVKFEMDMEDFRPEVFKQRGALALLFGDEE